MMDNIPEITVHVLNGTQTEEEMRAFMQWYNESSENKEFFLQMKQIYDLTNHDQRPEKEELHESWNRLLKRTTLSMKSTRPRSGERKKKTRSMIFSGVAAVALLLLAVGIKINSDNNTWIEIQSLSPGELTVVDLPDGSKVHLNASSTIKYPKRFNKKSRDLHLNGEAYFIVAKNSEQPFIVHSDKIYIEVLGTEFNVQAYDVDDVAVTTLVSGKVKLVTPESNEDMQNEFVLQPGDQATFNKISSTTQISNVETAVTTSWMNGEYSFRNKSLAEITSRLEKIYDVTFVIMDETLNKEEYTGKFFSDQSIEEIVDIINFKKQFSYRIENDTVYMERK